MTALSEGHRLGPYRIVRLLGEGGMGAVYEARQEPLDRRVALKTLHAEYAGNKESVARFFNEAKTLSRLEHPSIVQVSDFGTDADGTAYLVMEYLRGQSLGGRLRDFAARGDRLPVVTALQFGLQVADVLAVAHAQGIVHRDIKPDNLMLVADAVAPGGERVKLLDFGIAKITHEKDKGGVKTATQTVMGTPSYMSPEQCAGAGGVDAKTDVYALGCVLFEVLAGRPPFVAEGPGQLIGMHLFQTPPSLASLAPKVPAELVELVQRLLTKDKAQRPAMSETADEIGKLLSRQTGGGAVARSRHIERTDPKAGEVTVVPAPATTLGRSIGQQVSHSSRRTMVLGASVVCLLAVGSVFISRRNTSQPARPIPLATPTEAVPMAAPAVKPPAVSPPQPVVAAPSIPAPAKAMPPADKPDSLQPRPASKPPVPRQPARTMVSKPSGTSSSPPNKPEQKKPIGYVPL
jgi:serine/threonine protein kinase